MAECLKYTRDLQKLNPEKYVADIASWRKERDMFLPLPHTSTRSQTSTNGLPWLDTVTYIHLLSDRLGDYALCLGWSSSSSQVPEIAHEALEWSRELHRVDPAKYAADLALRLNDYGVSLHSAESYSAACEAKSESVEMTRDLHRADPAKYAADLALRLNNYGISLHSVGSYSAACEAKSELVEMTRAAPPRRSRQIRRRPRPSAPKLWCLPPPIGLLFCGLRGRVRFAGDHP